MGVRQEGRQDGRGQGDGAPATPACHGGHTQNALCSLTPCMRAMLFMHGMHAHPVMASPSPLCTSHRAFPTSCSLTPLHFRLLSQCLAQGHFPHLQPHTLHTLPRGFAAHEIRPPPPRAAFHLWSVPLAFPASHRASPTPANKERALSTTNYGIPFVSTVNKGQVRRWLMMVDDCWAQEVRMRRGCGQWADGRWVQRVQWRGR